MLHGANWAWTLLFYFLSRGVSVWPSSNCSEASKSCFHLGLCPGWGTGPAPLLDQSCQKAAWPLLDPILVAVAPLSLSPSKPQEETELGGLTRCLMRRLCLSQVQALTEPPTREYLTSEGMFLKMNLKVSQQILHSKEKKDPFFVPKTVDMLVQHPQGQAINLFFLINKSR